MYPISEAFQRVLDSRIGRNRTITWWGTITLTDGTAYDFDADSIAQGTGVLTSSCELPGIGGAYSTEFQAQFYQMNIMILFITTVLYLTFLIINGRK